MNTNTNPNPELGTIAEFLLRLPTLSHSELAALRHMVDAEAAERGVRIDTLTGQTAAKFGRRRTRQVPVL